MTSMSSSFRSSSISLGLHGQVIPDFVSDVLLEGNMASVLGNYDDPEDQGATGCCVLEPGSVPPPPPSPPLPHPLEPLHLLPYPGLVAPVPSVFLTQQHFLDGYYVPRMVLGTGVGTAGTLGQQMYPCRDL